MAKKLRAKKLKMRPGDFTLVVMVLLLAIFGVIMVFSASYYWSIDKHGTPYYFLIRAGFWVVSGFFIMLFFAMLDYHKLGGKFAIAMLIVATIALALVPTPLGLNINGASRWIRLGPITIMPGELAKFAVIIFVSWFFSEKPERIKSLIRGVLPMIFLCGVFGGLIMLQPNLSTAATVVGVIVAIMFIAGLNYWYLGGLAGLGVFALIVLIISDTEGYRWKRYASFLDPFKDPKGDGWQVVNSLLALGSGGIFGLGLGKSVQKNLYLPEPQNDFILSIIGEELGYVAIWLLLLIYIVIIWRGIKIAMLAKDRFGMLLASGVTAMIGIQVIFNVAVVTATMPPTGVTLPFISYGGNAMWMFMASTGILLNISRQQVVEGD